MIFNNHFDNCATDENTWSKEGLDSQVGRQVEDRDDQPSSDPDGDEDQVMRRQSEWAGLIYYLQKYTHSVSGCISEWHSDRQGETDKTQKEKAKATKSMLSIFLV